MAANQRWEKVKLDVFRIYIQGNKTLEDTMTAIQRSHGFQRGERSWKYKLDEWGFKKNIATHDMQWIVAEGAKRARKGKETTVSYKGVQVTTKRIEKFKRRRVGEVPHRISAPRSITFHTPPSLDHEEDYREDLLEASVPLDSPPPETSSSIIAHASSDGSLCFVIERPLSINSDPTQVLPTVVTSMLDQYLYGEMQPWSAESLSHQLGDHNSALAKHRQLFQQTTDLFARFEHKNLLSSDLPDEPKYLSKLCYVGNQFTVECCPATDDVQGDTTSDAEKLEELFDLAAALALSQYEVGEFARPTLKLEYSLAVADKNNNYEKEAEYHCRRILAHNPHAHAQALLGMILAEASRLEESTFWLFSAVATFIIAFDRPFTEPVPLRFLRFEPIEALFIKLNTLKTEEDWGSLASCMCQMMLTIQTSISDETFNRIFPQLLIHGFSIAHACSVLGHNSSAECMYQALLKHSSALNNTIYGIEKATAHRDYGLLHAREGRWMSSAQQLLSACKSAIALGIHDSHIAAGLKRDYEELLPHMAFESLEEDSPLETIEEMLALLNNRQRSPYRQDILTGAQRSRIDSYMSSDLPIQLVTVDHSEISAVSQFGLPSNSTGGDRDRSSIKSMSDSLSHSRGVTYPASESTDMAYSGLVWS